jgi:DNA-binding Lrp family transcriptional regulator
VFGTCYFGWRGRSEGVDANIMITAVILINTAQGRTPEVAQAMIDLPGVTEAYSVAGQYDLVAIARLRHHEELADLVAGHVQKIPGIEATNTLIAFRAYSQRNLEAMWEIGNAEPAK